MKRRTSCRVGEYRKFIGIRTEGKKKKKKEADNGERSHSITRDNVVKEWHTHSTPVIVPLRSLLQIGMSSAGVVTSGRSFFSRRRPRGNKLLLRLPSPYLILLPATPDLFGFNIYRERSFIFLLSPTFCKLLLCTLLRLLVVWFEHLHPLITSSSAISSFIYDHRS